MMMQGGVQMAQGRRIRPLGAFVHIPLVRDRLQPVKIAKDAPCYQFLQKRRK